MRFPCLVGQASIAFAHPDQALADGARLAPWRAGVVVLRQEVDDGMPLGKPIVMALHGRVPDEWLAADRIAA